MSPSGDTTLSKPQPDTDGYRWTRENALDDFRPLRVHVFRNGHTDGGIVIAGGRRNYREWTNFLDEIQRRLNVATVVKRLYKTDGAEVNDFASLENGERYVAASGDFVKLGYGEQQRGQVVKQKRWLPGAKPPQAIPSLYSNFDETIHVNRKRQRSYSSSEIQTQSLSNGHSVDRESHTDEPVQAKTKEFSRANWSEEAATDDELQEGDFATSAATQRGQELKRNLPNGPKTSERTRLRNRSSSSHPPLSLRRRQVSFDEQSIQRTSSPRPTSSKSYRNASRRGRSGDNRADRKTFQNRSVRGRTTGPLAVDDRPPWENNFNPTTVKASDRNVPQRADVVTKAPTPFARDRPFKGFKGTAAGDRPSSIRSSSSNRGVVSRSSSTGTPMHSNSTKDVPRSKYTFQWGARTQAELVAMMKDLGLIQ